MPTVIYDSTPVVYLRTKKTGSHSVKHMLRQYADSHKLSILDVRSSDTDTLEDKRFISHMSALALSQRLDVWNEAYKFTFIRNPWEVISSYYVFCKYTGPMCGWNNPDNYNLSNIDNFVHSLRDIHGTTNFNREIYTIDNNLIADVYDVKDIPKVFLEKFDLEQEIPKYNTQTYSHNDHIPSKTVDKYLYEDYDWEINEFGYTKTSLD